MFPRGKSNFHIRTSRWYCTRCSLQNSAEVNICQICFFPRPGPSWNCARCTFKNKASDVRCQICAMQKMTKTDGVGTSKIKKGLKLKNGLKKGLKKRDSGKSQRIQRVQGLKKQKKGEKVVQNRPSAHGRDGTSPQHAAHGGGPPPCPGVHRRPGTALSRNDPAPLPRTALVVAKRTARAVTRVRSGPPEAISNGAIISGGCQGKVQPGGDNPNNVSVVPQPMFSNMMLNFEKMKEEKKNQRKDTVNVLQQWKTITQKKLTQKRNTMIPILVFKLRTEYKLTVPKHVLDEIWTFLAPRTKFMDLKFTRSMIRRYRRAMD